MNEEQLKKLHKALMIIVAEIDRICRANGIRYSLSGGSMIGSVRHQGIIPWDDDVDIAMLREDYEKFMEACKTQLKDEFILENGFTDEAYFYGFSKILLKDTSLVQFGQEKTKYKKGIFVDVFPLDNVPENEGERKKHEKLNYLLIKMLFRKGGSKIEASTSRINKILFGVIDVINIPFSLDCLKRKLDENMKKYSSDNTEKICNMGGFYGYKKQTTYRAYFEEYIDVPFEGHTVMIIKDYDKYLTNLYGDYMKLPPVEKRRTHGFQNLNFGPYDELLKD